MDKEKLKLFEEAMSKVEKDFGKGSLIKLGDKAGQDIPAISTGSFAIDVALGVGGFPKARIVELYGAEQSGKSSLALSTIAQAQKTGGICAYIDAEHALDVKWAKLLGVDVDALYLSQPASGEEGLEILNTIVCSNAAEVVVVDSVAALVPKSELEGEFGSSQMGVQARLMSQAMRKLTAVIAKSGTCVIFINQIRNKIGGYGNPETVTGGLALKYYASVRVDCRRGEVFKRGEELIGHQLKAKVVKSRISTPFKIALASFYYDRGFDNATDIFNEAVKLGVVKKSGTWFSYNDERLAQGTDNSVEVMKGNPTMFETIELQVKKGLGIIKDEPETPKTRKSKKDVEAKNETA